MASWFAEFSAFTVFLAIAGIGFLFLLVSLVFGELFGHFDHGGFEHDMDHGGPSFFSPRILSVFITAFGGFGAVATHYGLSAVGSSAVGFGGGVAFASVIYAFARFLWREQSATEIRTTDLIGQSARVIIAIPAGGLGQVRCRIGEQLVDKIARSHDGQAVAENDLVRIEEVLGETVIVRRPT